MTRFPWKEAPAWSPTNDVIAYLSPTTTGVPFNNVKFVSAEGRPVFTSAPTSPGLAGGFGNGLIAWSHDGRQVAVVSQNANLPAAIWVIEPANPTPTIRKLIELGPGPRIRGMTWLPDDSGIVIGKHDWTSDIVLIDLTK